MIDWISFPTVGLGAGWPAFLSLAIYIVRKVLSGELVDKAQLDRAIAAGDKLSGQLDTLQETHRETVAQNTELLESARFTKAVTEAADQALQRRQS